MFNKEQLVLRNGSYYKETTFKKTINDDEEPFVLISDTDPVEEYSWSLLPSGKLKFMEPNDMIDYLASESDSTKE